MEVPEVKRLKSPEEENARLKKLLDEAMLDKEALAQALILNFIHSAAGSADVAAYDFTSETVAEALIQLAQSGVRVRVVADEKKITAAG